MKKVFKYLCISLSICAIIALTNSNIYADALSDYEAELEKIKAEQQANANKLTGIDKEIAQIVYDMLELDGKIGSYSIKLDELNKKVDAVNDKLKEQEDLLQNSAQTYNAAEEVYSTRLRIIYENGMPTILDILLESKGISDFFSKINVLNSILDYDKSLVSNMKTQKEYIDNIKKNIEIQKAQLEQLTYDAEKSATALENAKKAKEMKIDSLKKSQSNLKALGAELAKQEREAAKKIQEEIEKMQSNGSFNGMWCYPTPGFTIITARFNEKYDPWESGSSSTHSGTDIAGSGISGSKILAMGSGTVVTASYGWNYGYGNYIIIDHGKSALDGKKYKTLYGHCQSLSVTKGQVVTKGQIIGYVGSTGNSTGPHLHLELYRNNVRMNALDMFKGMKFTYR